MLVVDTFHSRTDGGPAMKPHALEPLSPRKLLMANFAGLRFLRQTVKCNPFLAPFE
jgi:hypothetical protein